FTALHLAVVYNRPDIAAILLKSNVDIQAQTDHGWTATDVAEDFGYEVIVELLNEEDRLRNDGSLLSNVSTLLGERLNSHHTGESSSRGRIRLRECMICRDDLSIDEFPSVTHLKMHEICQSCYSKYLRIKILDERNTIVPCPSDSCELSLSYEDIK